MKIDFRHSMPYFTLIVGMLIATSSGASASPTGKSCLLTCINNVGTCQLVIAKGKEETWNPGTSREIANCEPIVIGKESNVLLRYRHKHKWFSPPNIPDGRIDLVFKAFPPDLCSTVSPLCIQQAMQEKSSSGGHGIDSRTGASAGTGEPCGLGFPCGMVVPPGSAKWFFHLEDASISGLWVVRMARGSPPVGREAEIVARVEGGQVQAQGDWFRPGAVYSYRLANSAGTTIASGEFSVISNSMYGALQRIVKRRVAGGTPESAAWVDALMENNLEWDAYQYPLVTGSK